MTDNDQQTWLDDVTARFGPARLSNPDGVQLADRIRRFWVWFPNDVNHNVAIDERGPGRWEASAGGTLGSAAWIGRTEPTDEQMRALCQLAGLLPAAAPVDKRARQVADSILANARADADRAHKMHDEASDEVDRLRTERRLLRRHLARLADRMTARAREASNPADGAAMGDFAESIRALVNHEANAATCPCGPGAPVHLHGIGGYSTTSNPAATWRPARPGDTPGQLMPEHGPIWPVDLARPVPADERPAREHVIAFAADGTWSLEHPPTCRAGERDLENGNPIIWDCAVRALAERQIPADLAALMAGGRYTCSAGDLGDLFQLGERLHDDQCTAPVCAACGCWCHLEEQAPTPDHDHTTGYPTFAPDAVPGPHRPDGGLTGGRRTALHPRCRQHLPLHRPRRLPRRRRPVRRGRRVGLPLRRHLHLRRVRRRAVARGRRPAHRDRRTARGEPVRADDLLRHRLHRPSA